MSGDLIASPSWRSTASTDDRGALPPLAPAQRHFACSATRLSSTSIESARTRRHSSGQEGRGPYWTRLQFTRYAGGRFPLEGFSLFRRLSSPVSKGIQHAASKIRSSYLHLRRPVPPALLDAIAWCATSFSTNTKKSVSPPCGETGRA